LEDNLSYRNEGHLTAKKIWALLDERAGNTSQTLGVADALGLPYEPRIIRFGRLIRLPNPLVWWNRMGITHDTRTVLEPPWPDITISTARRLGLVAAYIKRRNPATFTAQIQWPGYPGGNLDLIATPQHDGIKAGGNIILTLGAPHRVTPEKLAAESEAWRAPLAHLPSPRIAVLIGGSPDPADFAKRHAVPLATYASDLARRINGSLLITTSRRTGDAMPEQMKPHLNCPYYLYAWQQGGNPPANPYYGFLGLADMVIATGDSVSMCSEACATGKPVFIYEGDDFMSRKYKKFVKALYAQNLARPLHGNDKPFTPPYRLDDSAEVAKQIRARLGLS
jgi:mitochondrial fission protein ELM1